MRRSTFRASIALALAGLVLAGCDAGLVSSTTAARPGTTVARTVPTSTTTTTFEQPGWTPVSVYRGSVVADRRTVTGSDGNTVTIYRFRVGRVRFALHAGSMDPPGVAAAAGAASGPSISPAEAPNVVAAFNGGFKVNSGSGGFELNSHVYVPLRAGVASVVIDANGSAHVGVWGVDLPAPNEQVASVRQNLAALVIAGHLSPLINDIAAWGSTLGGGPVVARSSLGEDAQGNILYAAGMGVLPADLGTALIEAGAVRAMQLDINPEWIQLASAPRPGGVLVAGIPDQHRPGNQYQVGWLRDFVTVLAGK
jgi:hypothetical protein